MNPEQFNILVQELTQLSKRDTNKNLDHEMNPNFAVPKIKPTLKACDTCGRQVKSRVVTIKLVTDDATPHWRTRCNICKFVTIKPVIK